MDVRQLRYFVSILNYKSFSKAAEHLRVSQTAIGLQLRKLEYELGVRLVVRHSRGVEPTDEGVTLLAEANRILSDIDEVKSRFTDSAKELKGQLVLGISMAALPAIITLIERCRVELPNVFIHITEALSPTLVDWLATDRIDMAIGHQAAIDRPGIRNEPLFKQGVYFVEGAKFAKPRGKTITLKEAAEYPLVVPRLPNFMEGYTGSDRPKFSVVCEVESAGMLAELIERGLGAAILPSGIVDRQIADGRIIATKLVEPEMWYYIALMYSDSRPRTKIEKTVREILRQIVNAEIARAGTTWYAPEKNPAPSRAPLPKRR